MAAPAAGLLAVSLGSHAEDGHPMLEAMMPMDDALCAWCVDLAGGQVEINH